MRGGRITLRLRLALLYGVCFVLAGGALLAITYAVVAHETTAGAESFVLRGARISLSPANPTLGSVRTPGPLGPGTTISSAEPPAAFERALRSRSQVQLNHVVRRANVALRAEHQSSLAALLLWSGVALGIMALVSIGLGWLVAGRGLRPLRTMNARARAITADNLHERLGDDDRDDELGELARSFDGVLERLERAFAAQRRFVANASHELRTPITLERALVEVALANPEADAATLRATCERVLAASERQERLIDALLALARGEAGAGERRPVDLAALVSAARHERPWFEAQLGRAVTQGDPALLERLVANLLDNAIVHNRAGGTVVVRTGVEEGRPLLRVLNDGPHVSPEQVTEILEPFRRLDGERTGGGGLGLGLSIVRSIAEAHDAELDLRPRPQGGLDVRVRFPARSDSGATLERPPAPRLLAAS